MLLWNKGLFVLELSAAIVLWKSLEYFFCSSILYQRVKKEKPSPHFCHTTKVRFSFVITLKVQKLELKIQLTGKHSLPSNKNFERIKLTTYTSYISFPCQKGLNTFVVNSKFAYCKRYNANHNSPTHFPGNKNSAKEQQEVSFLLQYPGRALPVPPNRNKVSEMPALPSFSLSALAVYACFKMSEN